MLNLWSDDAATVRLWSLTDDALVEEGDRPGVLVLVSRWGEQVLDADEVTAESLRRMGFGPVTLRNTLPGSAGGGPPVPVAVRALEAVLDRVGSCVVHSLALPDGQRPLLSVEPLVPRPVFRPEPLPLDAVVRLSRFATLRPGRTGLVLEGPDSGFRVVLHQALARTVATGLVEPTTPAALAAAVGAPPVVVAEMLSFLVAAGATRRADLDGTLAEDDDPDLRGWGHHELLFHQQSRLRARSDGTGAQAPPPVVRPLPRGSRYPLARPAPDGAGAAGPSLDAVLETDHVCPDLTDGVVTAEELGELLYRSARIRSTGPAHLPSPDGGPAHDASQRPYASIACLYELEVYLTLGRCTGLPSGVYHYDPLGHALTRLPAGPDEVGQVLDVGRVGAGSVRRPAVVMTIAARPARVSWILPGSAYAVALMHCGALQETVYLVAKAMGLWAHAVPTDAHVVDRVLGLRWPAEVGLGECVLDVLPAGTALPAGATGA